MANDRPQRRSRYLRGRKVAARNPESTDESRSPEAGATHDRLSNNATQDLFAPDTTHGTHHEMRHDTMNDSHLQEHPAQDTVVTPEAAVIQYLKDIAPQALDFIELQKDIATHYNLRLSRGEIYNICDKAVKEGILKVDYAVRPSQYCYRTEEEREADTRAAAQAESNAGATVGAGGDEAETVDAEPVTAQADDDGQAKSSAAPWTSGRQPAGRLMLEYLQKTGERLTGSELKERLGLNASVTSLSNSLSRLVKNGDVARQQEGIRVRFYATRPKRSVKKQPTAFPGAPAPATASAPPRPDETVPAPSRLAEALPAAAEGAPAPEMTPEPVFARAARQPEAERPAPSAPAPAATVEPEEITPMLDMEGRLHLMAAGRTLMVLEADRAYKLARRIFGYRDAQSGKMPSR